MKNKRWKIFLTLAVLIVAIVMTVIMLQPDKFSYNRHTEEIMQMEQTDLDSPISGIRTGLYRDVSSLGDNEFECTDDGVYYLAGGEYLTAKAYNEIDSVDLGVSYLFYCDHNSNKMIKLCGRPDCNHDTVECNAVFVEPVSGVTYYDGHLYIATFASNGSLMELWQMTPDGGSRRIVMDATSVNSDKYDGYYPAFFQNGVFGINLTYMDENGIPLIDSFYSKLNGSIQDLKPMFWGSFWNDGFSFLSGSLKNLDGQADGKWHLYNWDPDTNTREQLVEMPEEIISDYISGYWGVDAGYAMVNGIVQKINYPDGAIENLFETGLSGGYTVEFFPDCIAMLETGSRSEEDPAMMYFYSWEGEKLGEVEIGFNNDVGAMLFGGESKDRIMLRGSIYYSLPEYYIEKSDFGTGNIEIHKFEYPDLDEETYTAIFGEE